MIPPPSQNTMGICNQITLLILYYISSRMVTLPKVTDAPIQVSDILGPTVKVHSIQLSDIPSFDPEMSTSFMFYIIYITYIALQFGLLPFIKKS